MDLMLKCKRCGRELRAHHSAAGKSVRCPKCEAVNHVPAANGHAKVTRRSDPTVNRLAALDAFDSADLRQVTPKKTCPSCSHEIERDAVVCLSCGYNFETGEAPERDDEDDQSPVTLHCRGCAATFTAPQAVYKQGDARCPKCRTPCRPLSAGEFFERFVNQWAWVLGAVLLVAALGVVARAVSTSPAMMIGLGLIMVLMLAVTFGALTLQLACRILNLEKPDFGQAVVIVFMDRLVNTLLGAFFALLSIAGLLRGDFAASGIIVLLAGIVGIFATAYIYSFNLECSWPVGILLWFVQSVLSVAIGLALVFILGLSLSLPGIGVARIAAREAQCKNNLKQIGIAMHNYHDAWGSFPPAVTYDSDGKPAHSWRVLILPFVEEVALYNQYNFKQPWDSASNRPLIEKMPAVYACPEAPAERGNAQYFAITGTGTAFPPRGASTLRDFVAGTSNTPIIGERQDWKVPWTQPVDIVAGKDGLHAESSEGPHVLMADGNVQASPNAVDPQVLSHWAASVKVAAEVAKTAKSAKSTERSKPAVVKNVPAASNRPPRVEILQFEPREPKLGDTLKVTLEAEDPDEDAVVLKYRLSVRDEWQAVPSVRVIAIECHKPGRLQVEVLAIDEHGKEAEIVRRSCLVRLTEPLASWKSARSPLRGHTGAVHGLAFTADSARLVSAGEDGTMRIWRISTGRAEQPLLNHADSALNARAAAKAKPTPITSVAVRDPDGHLVTTDTSNRLRVWQMDGRPVSHTTVPDLKATLTAFSADGRWLAIGQNYKLERSRTSVEDRYSIRLSKVGGEEIASIRPDHAGVMTAIAFSPSAKTVASGNRDGSVHIWKLASSSAPQTLRATGDRTPAVAAGADAKSTIISMAFSADDSLFAMRTAAGDVSVWDLADAAMLHTFSVPAVDVGPLADKVTTILRFTPDGSQLASTNENGTVSLWRVVDGAGATLSTDSKPLRCLSFSADRKWMATAGPDGIIRLWQVGTNE